MDFFKSVFSPDLDPITSEEASPSPPAPPNPNPNPNNPNLNPNPTGVGWSLGGLIKTVASRSESVIQTYRKDLEEFGSGLKKETVAIREAAARSIDEIITHSKDAILAVDSNPDQSINSSGKRYTRLEAQIIALQSDLSTFTSDPDDLSDFENWKLGFNLEEKKEEIEMLCYDSDVLEGMIEKLVPDTVDSDNFWSRYFYKVYKIKQAEEARAELVKRVIRRDEQEEDLSWEVDDEIEEKENEKEKENERENENEKIEMNQDQEKGNNEVETVEKLVDEMENVMVSQDKIEETQKEITKEDEIVEKECIMVSKSEDGSTKIENLESKSNDNENLGKDIKPNVQQVEQDEDLEWDEIEDLGEGYEKKPIGSSTSPALKEDLRKRLSVAEDDEDLSWDIEE